MRMDHPHELFKSDTKIKEVPDFSIVIAFYNRPWLLEQCISTIKKYAVNKNHEILAVADHDECLINSHYPTSELAKRIDTKGYFRKNENQEKMSALIHNENITIRKCMDEYSQIKWISLFEYLRGEKTVDGFNYNLKFPTDGRPGRGNFYLSYNLGGRLAKNEFIMQMVNDDMIFGPEWDLKMWRALQDKDKMAHSCVPFTLQAGTKTDIHTSGDLLCHGAEAYWKAKDSSYSSYPPLVLEKDFLNYSSKIRLLNTYLIEKQHERHYGYMGMMLLHRDLFFSIGGYNMKGYPNASQDICLDSNLGVKSVNKIVVLDTIHLHKCMIYITDENRELIYGD